MLIVGELINASRKSVKEIIEKMDNDAVAKLASEQRMAGADYIDVNAGIFVGREAEYLQWLVTVVQGAVDGPCCIDSPDPAAIEAALERHVGKAMINSISLEKERWEHLLPTVAGAGCKVVALCMSDEGMPETGDARMSIAERLINGLVKNNVPEDDIYVDPLVQPIGTNHEFGREFLDAVTRMTTEFPNVHTMCGLSNISFGLPERKYLNQIFMTMAIARGLDGAITNPLDKTMMAGIVAAETLVGKDPFCMKYLKAFRAGLLTS